MVELAAKPESARKRKFTSKSDGPAQLVVSRVTADDGCAALQTHIAERLVSLRAEFQEALACYSVRAQGMLSQSADLLLDDIETLSAADRKRREKALQRMIETMDSLALKPAKGRRRDLKAVEKFATQLGNEVAEW